MDWSYFGIRLLSPFPIFHGLAGDELLVQVGTADPLTLIRRLPPNYGAVIDAMERGLILPSNPRRQTGELLAALSHLTTAPVPWPRALRPAVGRSRHLWLER